MQRIVGFAVGLATQVLFLFTVWHLFWFLKGEYAERNSGSLWIDVVLALQFAIPHSLLLLPAVRRRLVRWIDTSFYGCFYSAATCFGLLLTFTLWRSSPTELWRFEGWAGTAIATAFIGAWVSLMYSLNLTGLGFQRRTPTRRSIGFPNLSPHGTTTISFERPLATAMLSSSVGPVAR